MCFFYFASHFCILYQQVNSINCIVRFVLGYRGLWLSMGVLVIHGINNMYTKIEDKLDR